VATVSYAVRSEPPTRFDETKGSVVEPDCRLGERFGVGVMAVLRRVPLRALVCSVLVAATLQQPEPAHAASPVEATPLPLTVTSGSGCTIVGTPRVDVLVGTRRADVIFGRGGNDVLATLCPSLPTAREPTAVPRARRVPSLLIVAPTS
jgi:hypothetical protein